MTRDMLIAALCDFRAYEVSQFDGMTLAELEEQYESAIEEMKRVDFIA